MTRPEARRASAGDTPQESGGAAGGLAAWPGARRGLRRVGEYLAVALLGLLVLVVHDVGYLLRVPFWTDESWVAVTTRFPLSQLPAATSSTPIGWTVLLRLVTAAGTQTGRLLPLAFAAAAVVAAYWLGRGLGWPRPGASVAAGLLAAVGVLLAPAMLVRDDLKQYTADACAALLTLAMTSRLERRWSRRGLVALSAIVSAGTLFSVAAAFAGAAAFVAVPAVQLSRRSWLRFAESVVAGGCTAAVLFGIYTACYAHAVVPGLTAYWGSFFLPAAQGFHADISFVTSHVGSVGRDFGLGPAWLAVAAVATGLVTLFRLGRPGVAVTVALLWAEMLALSAARTYPFMDLRTSTFLFAVTAAVAAIGLAGVCSLLWPRLRGTLAAALAAAGLAAFAAGAQPYARSHPIPNEDVRDQARYVAAHAARGDVILVNLSSNWGFAYYWPAGHPSRRADAAVLQGYEAVFPDQPDIVVARTREPAGVEAALSQALGRAGCGRIWLVRTHLSEAEKRAWQMALARDKLTDTPVGDAGLRVIRPGSARCR